MRGERHDEKEWHDASFAPPSCRNPPTWRPCNDGGRMADAFRHDGPDGKAGRASCQRNAPTNRTPPSHPGCPGSAHPGPLHRGWNSRSASAPRWQPGSWLHPGVAGEGVAGMTFPVLLFQGGFSLSTRPSRHPPRQNRGGLPLRRSPDAARGKTNSPGSGTLYPWLRPASATSRQHGTRPLQGRPGPPKLSPWRPPSKECHIVHDSATILKTPSPIEATQNGTPSAGASPPLLQPHQSPPRPRSTPPMLFWTGRGLSPTLILSPFLANASSELNRRPGPP